MSKKAGRPKIGAKNAKGVFIAARFTPSEAQEINEAIRLAQATKSDWVRKTLLTAAKG